MAPAGPSHLSRLQHIGAAYWASSVAIFLSRSVSSTDVKDVMLEELGTISGVCRDQEMVGAGHNLLVRVGDADPTSAPLAGRGDEAF